MWGLAFVAGVAAGWLAGIFTTEQTKDKVRGKAKQLKNLLRDPQEQAKVKAIFNEVTEDTMRKYNHAKDRLITGLNELKVSVDQIDKQKYTDVVNEVIQEMKQEKDIAAKQLTQLQKYLEEDFNLLRGNMQNEKNSQTESE